MECLITWGSTRMASHNWGLGRDALHNIYARLVYIDSKEYVVVPCKCVPNTICQLKSLRMQSHFIIKYTAQSSSL